MINFAHIVIDLENNEIIYHLNDHILTLHPEYRKIIINKMDFVNYKHSDVLRRIIK